MIEFLRKYQPIVVTGSLALILFCIITPIVGEHTIAVLARLVVLGGLLFSIWHNWAVISQVFPFLAGEEDGSQQTVEPADDVEAES